MNMVIIRSGAPRLDRTTSAQAIAAIRSRTIEVTTAARSGRARAARGTPTSEDRRDPWAQTTWGAAARQGFASWGVARRTSIASLERVGEIVIGRKSSFGKRRGSLGSHSCKTRLPTRATCARPVADPARSSKRRSPRPARPRPSTSRRSSTPRTDARSARHSCLMTSCLRTVDAVKKKIDEMMRAHRGNIGFALPTTGPDAPGP